MIATAPPRSKKAHPPSHPKAAESLKQIGTIQQLLRQEHQTGEAANAHDGHRATELSYRKGALLILGTRDSCFGGGG